jgi:4-amino-4-deoxy-L-arabinose transferase-like glycosyltransferase
MFHYKAWLQTTPPLFLLLVRETVHFAGVSVGSFRAVPFGLSVLSLILIAWLSRLTLRTPFAVLCTTLVALSPPAVVFSKEVKQYSGDVAASCLLLLVLWRYLDRPDRRRYTYLISAFAVALFLSYPAVAFVPAAIAVVAEAEPILKGDHPYGWKSRLQRVGILAALSAAICNVNYWLFVKPNTSALLANYWSSGYPRFNRFTEVVQFYAEYFLGMGVCFYLPMGTKNLFKSVLFSAGHFSLALIAMGTIGILALALATLRRNKRHLQTLALCFMPLVALAVLNLLHLYPVNSRRLTLFMLPCISLAAGIVMQSVWDTLSKGSQRKRVTLFPALITVACIVIVFVAGTHADQWSNYWFEDEDTGGAFRYLRSHFVPEDTIYIHASIAEPAKLYFRILHWDPSDVRYGNTGWGCCKRNPEPQIDVNSQRDYVIRDFERVLGERRPGRLWLLFTGRDGHWGEIGRDEPRMIATYLYGIDCQKELEKRFANEVLDEFACRRKN